MLSKTALSVSILAAATAVGAWTTVSALPPKPTSEPLNQCSTADAQCCNTVTSATNPAAQAILSMLGVVVQGVDVLVGLTCSPIHVIGISASESCAQQTVCCTNNQFNGVINIGCTPIVL